MRHRSSVNHLGRTAAHRNAMERNIAIALIEHERIVTTVQKAKNIKGFVERLVTLAKEPTVHHRRLASAKLNNKVAVSKLFSVLGPRFKSRPGGYTRILKLAKPRLGDNGSRAILEFVERTPKEDENATPTVETAQAEKPGKAAKAVKPKKTAAAS